MPVAIRVRCWPTGLRWARSFTKAGKVKALLMTGDNSEQYYNEPEAMRRYALRLGVPYAAIVLDYAGFRTYDSCYRARDIFQVRQAISGQPGFHLDRALLVCNAAGGGVSGRGGGRAAARGLLAPFDVL